MRPPNHNDHGFGPVFVGSVFGSSGTALARAAPSAWA